MACFVRASSTDGAASAACTNAANATMGKAKRIVILLFSGVPEIYVSAYISGRKRFAPCEGQVCFVHGFRTCALFRAWRARFVRILRGGETPFDLEYPQDEPPLACGLCCVGLRSCRVFAVGR